MMKDVEIISDEEGNIVVLINDIVFTGRQNIDWKTVEIYLKKYVEQYYIVLETSDSVYIGRDFPKELKNVKVDPKDIAHIEAIILSMTPYERKHPEVLKATRKQRISKGCGRDVAEINRLINQFEQMKKMMKMMKNGKMPF